MTDTSIDIHREGGNVIRARGVLNDPRGVNQLTQGQTAEFRVFDPEERLEVASDTTIAQGDTRTEEVTVIQSGVTLTVNGTLDTGRLENNGTLDNNGTVIITGDTDALSFNAYADRAGGFTTQETLDSTVTFREFLPSSGDVTSLLVGVEPAQDLQNADIPGIWGLIESVEDSRRPVLNRSEQTIQVRVLARYTDYADHAAVRTALEV